MTNGSNGDAHVRSPIMELFRIEAANHCATLTDALLSLEKRPADPKLLEVLTRAAHSIKGAAQVVDLAAAAQLAKTMEAVFSTAQAGKVEIQQETIEELYNGVEMLNDLALAGDREIDQWLVDNGAGMTSLVDTLHTLVTTSDSAEQSGNDSLAATSPPADKRAENRDTSLDGLFDMSMLDLFRMETETHCATLTDSLLGLEKNPTDSNLLEALMRAAHSIKGAARVVNLHVGVQIAHAMEDVFVAAQKQTISLAREGIDCLLRGVDMLTEIANLTEDEADTEREAFAEEVTALESDLAKLSKPATTPEAEPPTPKQEVEDVKGARPEDIGALEAMPSLDDEKPQPDRETTIPAPFPGPSAASPDEEPVVAAATEKTPAAEAPGKPTITKMKPTTAADKGRGRAVRVSADNMNRLMGLAGEVLVETGRLPTLIKKLLRVKTRQDDVLRYLDKISSEIGEQGRGFKKSNFLELRQRVELCRNMLADHIADTEDHALRANEISNRLYQEVISSRMQPLSDGIQSFPRLVRDLARELGKQVNLEVVGADTLVDRDILEKIESPLNHLVRNAIDHGIEPPDERKAAGKPFIATLRIEARHSAGMLNIVVSDDGCGVDVEKLRRTVIDRKLAPEEIALDLSEPELLEFLFLPNFSTRHSVNKISGRGVGLDVVHSVLNEVRGVVRASSTLHQGTSFDLQLPLTLSVMRALLTEISEEPYSFPLVAIDHVLQLPREEIKEVEGRQYFIFNDRRIGLVSAQQVFEQPLHKEKKDLFQVVVFSDRFSQYGLIVDRFWGIRDLVVQPLNASLGKIKDISAAAILEDGTPTLIVDVEDMVRSMDILISDSRLVHVRQQAEEEKEVTRKHILVADDSITVREVERKMLSNKGYKVDVAVDGMDALNTLRNGNYDLLVTDVDMPRMNGIELVEVVKKDSHLQLIPIIIVSYKDREEDKNKGLEAGADYYLTKGSFQDETLVNAVHDLIGDPEV